MKKMILVSLFSLALGSNVAWAASQGLPQSNTAGVAANTDAINALSAQVTAMSAEIAALKAAAENGQGSSRSVHDANGVRVGDYAFFNDSTGMRTATRVAFFTSKNYVVNPSYYGSLRTYYLDANCVTPIAYRFSNSLSSASSGLVFWNASAGTFYMILANVAPQQLSSDAYAQSASWGDGNCETGESFLQSGSLITNEIIVPNDPAVSGFDPVANPGPYIVR